MENGFLCGAARVCITPPPELLPLLRGLKHYRFGGVLDDIYARVVAFEGQGQRALLVGFDMTTAPTTEEILQQLAAASGAPVENILFFAIHTHAVPACSVDLEKPEQLPPEVLEASRQYTAFLHRQVLAAAGQAVAALRPAKLGWAYGQSGVNVNRVQDYTVTQPGGESFTVCGLGADPFAPADKTLFALKAESLSGEPIAFLVNYAMHNVATIWNDCTGTGEKVMAISSDVGGTVSKLLEAEYPGSVALWSSAPAGDINPVMLNEVIYPDPVTGAPVEAAVSGKEHAETCLKLLSTRHYADVLRTVKTIACSQPEGRVRGAVSWSVTPGCDCVRRHGQPPQFLTGPEVRQHKVRLQLVEIGGVCLYGVGAELYTSFGQQILAQSPRKPTVIITHNASALSVCHYILDDAVIARADASHGQAMLPGYDEFRNQAGVMAGEFARETAALFAALER